jgi:hypothetical protein
LNYSQLIRLVIKPQVADCHTKGRQVQSGIVDVVPNTSTDAAPPKRKGKAKMRVWHIISLHREDINNSHHPNLWADLCDSLGFDPETTNAVDLKVVKATVTDASQ